MEQDRPALAGAIAQTNERQLLSKTTTDSNEPQPAQQPAQRLSRLQISRVRALWFKA